MKTYGHENLAKIRADFRSVFKGLDIRFLKTLMRIIRNLNQAMSMI